jgi:hypothetical protein
MKKRLFDADERYLPEASKLSDEAHRVLGPMVENLHQQGFALRDIEAVLVDAVSDECLSRRL